MSRTAALPTMWIGLLSPGSGVDEAAIQYGTSVARPTAAPAAAARSHHCFDRNTPHAAIANSARLASAPMLAAAHAAPPGGLLVPANDAVIHKNVLPYTSSAAAAMSRRVMRLGPCLLSVDSLVLPAWRLCQPVMPPAAA